MLLPGGSDEEVAIHGDADRLDFEVGGCRDAGQVDLRMDRNDRPQLMEINALSGLSSHSALPIIAAHAGMSFEMLVDRIICEAFARSRSVLMDRAAC